MLALLSYQHKHSMAQRVIFPIFALYFHAEECPAFGNKVEGCHGSFGDGLVMARLP